eukprot:COSAG01_NODE_16731_length_1210_cov_1.757876_2_plen_299_part_01
MHSPSILRHLTSRSTSFVSSSCSCGYTIACCPSSASTTTVAAAPRQPARLSGGCSQCGATGLAVYILGRRDTGWLVGQLAARREPREDTPRCRAPSHNGRNTPEHRPPARVPIPLYPSPCLSFSLSPHLGKVVASLGPPTAVVLGATARTALRWGGGGYARAPVEAAQPLGRSPYPHPFARVALKLRCRRRRGHTHQPGPPSPPTSKGPRSRRRRRIPPPPTKHARQQQHSTRRLDSSRRHERTGEIKNLPADTVARAPVVIIELVDSQRTKSCAEYASHEWLIDYRCLVMSILLVQPS